MESSAWPKNLSSSRKHAIQELLHGQNPTKKLRDFFDAHSQTGNDTGQPLFGEDLIVNALRSFSNTLSLSSSSESYEVFPVPSNACVMSVVSEENESINTPVPRKTSEAWTEGSSNFTDDGHSWRNYVERWLHNSEFPRKTSNTGTRLDHNLIDDGYSWRKYGQKLILNCKFPRCEFRCAFRVDQKCLATKQVQKMLNDPPVYQTVYRGHHTCGNPMSSNRPQSSWIHQAPGTPQSSSVSTVASLPNKTTTATPISSPSTFS